MAAGGPCLLQGQFQGSPGVAGKAVAGWKHRWVGMRVGGVTAAHPPSVCWRAAVGPRAGSWATGSPLPQLFSLQLDFNPGLPTQRPCTPSPCPLPHAAPPPHAGPWGQAGSCPGLLQLPQLLSALMAQGRWAGWWLRILSLPGRHLPSRSHSERL